MRKLIQKLIRKFFSWVYDQIEHEKNQRQLAKLLQLLEEKEARRVKQDNKAKENAQRLLAQYEDRKARCPHRKGGKMQAGYIDYNVMTHTFPDGRKIVKCLSCSKEWSEANKNFDEGLKLAKQSTNTATSSEIGIGPGLVRDRVKPERTDYQPQEEGPYEPLAPYASKGYIKLWDKMTKKFDKAKKARAARLKNKEAKNGLNHYA